MWHLILFISAIITATSSFTAAVTPTAYSTDGTEIGVSLVEAECNGFRDLGDRYIASEFKVVHVYLGAVARDGDVFYLTSDKTGPSFRSEIVWPVPKLHERGLFKVLLAGGHLERTSQGPRWFRNIFENEDRYAEYKTVAVAVEARERLEKDKQLGALREQANSSTEEVVAWAISTFASDFPREFVPYAEGLAERGRSSAQQLVSIDEEMAFLSPGSWKSSPIRLKLLSRLSETRPSKYEGSVVTTYLNVQTQNRPSTEVGNMLARICSAVALNTDLSLRDRSLACQDLGSMASGEKLPQAVHDLQRIQSSSDEPKIKDLAAFWLAKAQR